MCQFVARGQTCPYGDQCTYAHTQQQVRARDAKIVDLTRRLAKAGGAKY